MNSDTKTRNNKKYNPPEKTTQSKQNSTHSISKRDRMKKTIEIAIKKYNA